MTTVICQTIQWAVEFTACKCTVKGLQPIFRGQSDNIEKYITVFQLWDNNVFLRIMFYIQANFGNRWTSHINIIIILVPHPFPSFLFFFLCFFVFYFHVFLLLLSVHLSIRLIIRLFLPFAFLYLPPPPLSLSLLPLSLSLSLYPLSSPSFPTLCFLSSLSSTLYFSFYIFLPLFPSNLILYHLVKVC